MFFTAATFGSKELIGITDARFFTDQTHFLSVSSNQQCHCTEGKNLCSYQGKQRKLQLFGHICSMNDYYY